MRKHLFTVTVAFVIAVVLLLYLFSFQVRENERAVVTTFGKPKEPGITEPGLYWKWPFPVQRVYKFDARLRIFENQPEETITKDTRNIVLVSCVGWRIADPLTFLMRVGNNLEAERHLAGIVRSTQNAVLGKHYLSELVSVNEGDLKFDEIEAEMLALASGETLEKYGIAIELLKIKKLTLPESVLKAVFDRMKSERQILASRLKAEGEGEANRIRAAAESERDRMLAEAEGQAKSIMGEGDALAAKHYRVFKDYPELANFLKKVESLKAALKDRATIIVDTRTPPFDLLSEKPEFLASEEPAKAGADIADKGKVSEEAGSVSSE